MHLDSKYSLEDIKSVFWHSWSESLPSGSLSAAAFLVCIFPQSTSLTKTIFNWLCIFSWSLSNLLDSSEQRNKKEFKKIKNFKEGLVKANFLLAINMIHENKAQVHEL